MNRIIRHPFLLFLIISWVLDGFFGFMFWFGSGFEVPDWFLYSFLAPQPIFLVFGIYTSKTTRKNRIANLPFKGHLGLSCAMSFYNLFFALSLILKIFTMQNNGPELLTLPNAMVHSVIIVAVVSLLFVIIAEIRNNIPKKVKEALSSTQRGILSVFLVIFVWFASPYIFYKIYDMKTNYAFFDRDMMMAICIVFLGMIGAYSISQFQLRTGIIVFEKIYENALANKKKQDEHIEQAEKDKVKMEEFLHDNDAVKLNSEEMYFVLQGVMDKIDAQLKERAKDIFDAIENASLRIMKPEAGEIKMKSYTNMFFVCKDEYVIISLIAGGYYLKLKEYTAKSLCDDLLEEFGIGEIDYSYDNIHVTVYADEGEDGVRNVINTDKLINENIMTQQDIELMMDMDLLAEGVNIIEVICIAEDGARQKCRKAIDAERGVMIGQMEKDGQLLLEKTTISRDDSIVALLTEFCG